VAASTIISGFSSEASARASHRISRPSASVLPISTVSPLRVLTMSRGRKAFPDTEFSTQGSSTRSRTLSPARMIAWPSPSMIAAPAMSFFMLSMLDAGLRSRPPVSKHTPLPTSVTLGASAPPQVMSTSRGARVLARPTAWMVG
jgi:hypothetical protein